MNIHSNKFLTFCVLVCFGSLLISSASAAGDMPAASPPWEKKASLGFNALFPGVAVVNGKIYIFGGHTRIGDSFRPGDDFAEYDPQTNTVKQLPKLPTRRSIFGSAVVGNEIYIIGGTGDKPGKDSAQVDTYDTVKGLWGTKSSLNVPRAGLRAATLGDKIYTFGGYRGKGCIVEVYDIKTDKWSRLEDATHSILNPSAAVHEGKIYIVGGGIPDGTKAKGVIQVIDGATGKMSCLGDMPLAKGDHVVGFHQDRMFVIGGWNDRILKSVEVYDTKERTWTTRPDLPQYLHYHGIAVVEGKFFMVGGAHSTELASESSYSTAIFLYDPTR